MDRDERPPLLRHLEQLRKRLIASAMAIGIGFIIAYAFSEELFRVLAWPLKAMMAPEDRLIYTGLPEMFFVYIKIAFVGGLLLAARFIFYQAWISISPGLHQRERKWAFPFALCSFVLFVGGGLFGYFLVLPLVFKFFLGFENEHLHAIPSVKLYISFSMKLLFAFGMAFEFPLVVFFFTKAGLVTAELMKKKRTYAMLIIFIIAAILTPPDVITQLMTAIPLLLLYEVGIFISWMARNKERGPQEDLKGAGEKFPRSGSSGGG